MVITSNPSYTLAQNYPNPFNSQTEIEFQLSKAGHVKLSIYDVQGRVIKTLVEDHKIAGRYDIVWDGDNDIGVAVASGAYVMRLIGDDFVAMKKMILLR
ncbi:T9SS type A sorting domain-containing protein [candidate division KSB1 bacterium]|nr:T9SS type A sorting domain-containing protein [candidate division KSB1 bacterium]